MSEIQLMKDGRWRRATNFMNSTEQVKTVCAHARSCEIEALKKIIAKLKELGHDFAITDRSKETTTWVEIATADRIAKVEFAVDGDGYVGKLKLSMGGNYRMKVSGFRRQYKYDYCAGDASPKFYAAIDEGLKSINSANEREKQLNTEEKSTNAMIERTIRNMEHAIVSSWTSRVVAKLDPETPQETTVGFFVKGNTVSVEINLTVEACHFPELLSAIRFLNQNPKLAARYSC
jgi:hypothetical protein